MKEYSIVETEIEEVEITDKLRLFIGLACIFIGSRKLDEVVEDTSRVIGEWKTIVSFIPLELAASKPILLTAIVSSTISASRRRTISRNPGLEPLLYLLLERNIGKAIRILQEKTREKLIVVVAGWNKRDVEETINKITNRYRRTSCRIPSYEKSLEDKIRATRVSLFAALKKI